jgi:hypothetical protein
MGSCRSSQSQDLWWGELVETCRQPEKPPKGPKGQKVFCSFADGPISRIDSCEHRMLTQGVYRRVLYISMSISQ